MSEYLNPDGSIWDVNKDTSVLADLKSILRKLGVMPDDPLRQLMEALEAGSYSAAQNFGAPTQLIVSKHAYDALKNITYKDNDLKP